MKRMERRAFALEELRIDDVGDRRRIRGHAAVFDSLSLDLGGFREKIDPGAFQRTIREDDVRALVNHDPNLVLGRNKAGTLRLMEDARGLAIEIDPPDTQGARDLLTLLGRGDISQMSFGYYALSDRWETQGSEAIRTLEEVQLVDVSVVTFPAYPETDAGLRSAILAEGWARLARAGRGIDLLRREIQLARD
jgi:HK97 family phage prohead protease